MTKQLTLNYISPTVSYEGATLNTKSDGTLDVLFHQTTYEDNDSIKANVVAAIRIPNEKTWIQLKEMIDSTIANNKKREA
jgi:hypothetical protein